MARIDGGKEEGNITGNHLLRTPLPLDTHLSHYCLILVTQKCPLWIYYRGHLLSHCWVLDLLEVSSKFPNISLKQCLPLVTELFYLLHQTWATWLYCVIQRGKHETLKGCSVLPHSHFDISPHLKGAFGEASKYTNTHTHTHTHTHTQTSFITLIYFLNYPFPLCLLCTLYYHVDEYLIL